MTLTTETKKVGRPSGTKRQALSQWVSVHSRFTMGQLVRGLGWTMRDANDTIRRAVQRNELKVETRVPQQGCKRPVSVYAKPDASPAFELGSVMAGWVR
jgi:hypothetical protein